MSEDEEHDLTDEDQTNVTFDTCEWLLSCVHAIGANRQHYYMRCHPLKDMEDGERVKILVFGERAWDREDDTTKCRIRYVNKDRLVHRHTPKKYKGLNT